MRSSPTISNREACSDEPTILVLRRGVVRLVHSISRCTASLCTVSVPATFADMRCLWCAEGSTPTQAEIEEACRVANALEFIQQDQELGFKTVVGRGGGKLSGGQKQRIGEWSASSVSISVI